MHCTTEITEVSKAHLRHAPLWIQDFRKGALSTNGTVILSYERRSMQKELNTRFRMYWEMSAPVIQSMS